MPTVNETIFRHAKHFLEVLREANELYDSGTASADNVLESFQENWQNIRLGLERVARKLEDSLAAAELCIEYASSNLLSFAARLVIGEANHRTWAIWDLPISPWAISRRPLNATNSLWRSVAKVMTSVASVRI
jgi:hypothetical protein